MDLDTLFDVTLVVGVVTTVLSLGVSMTLAEAVAPLRRRGLVLTLLLVNILLVPAVAWAIALALPMTEPQVSALVLTSAGAGGAAGLKAAQLSRTANLPLAVSLVVLLQLANLVSLPFWIQSALPGASIPTRTLLTQLVALILVPLAIALLLRARRAGAAALTGPLVGISNVAVGAALVIGVVAHWAEIVSVLRSCVIPATLLIIAAGMAMGAAAARERADATTASLVSGMRFAALALVLISTSVNDDPAYLAPALVYSLLDLVVSIGVGLWLGRHARGLATTIS